MGAHLNERQFVARRPRPKQVLGETFAAYEFPSVTTSKSLSAMLRSYFSSFPLLFLAVLYISFLALTGCDTLSGSSDGGEGPPLLPPNVLAVDADASGDTTGASWENAYTDLQGALDSAEARANLLSIGVADRHERFGTVSGGV